MTDRRARTKGRRTAGAFVALPIEVLDSPAYIAMSAHAKALLVDIARQFRGHNNGDLAVAWSLMQRRGWRSHDTLQRARDELIATGLIEQTRQGGRHRCSLFAVTWHAIDACGGKLDVAPTRVASARWRRSKNNLVPRLPGQCAPPTGSIVGYAHAN